MNAISDIQQFPVFRIKHNILQCALLLPRLRWTNNGWATILVIINFWNPVTLLMIGRTLLFIFFFSIAALYIFTSSTTLNKHLMSSLCLIYYCNYYFHFKPVAPTYLILQLWYLTHTQFYGFKKQITKTTELFLCLKKCPLITE